jgi:hypothetical protein
MLDNNSSGSYSSDAVAPTTDGISNDHVKLFTFVSTPQN